MGIEAQETVPAPPRLLPTPQERAARESLTSTANNLEEGEGRTGGGGACQFRGFLEGPHGDCAGGQGLGHPCRKSGGLAGAAGMAAELVLGSGGQRRQEAWPRPGLDPVSAPESALSPGRWPPPRVPQGGNPAGRRPS